MENKQTERTVKKKDDWKCLCRDATENDTIGSVLEWFWMRGESPSEMVT